VPRLIKILGCSRVYLPAGQNIVGTEKRREKVVALRELQRAIIYTRELSKQAIEDHVSTAFTVY
jgi:hypothetical protein